MWRQVDAEHFQKQAVVFPWHKTDDFASSAEAQIKTRQGIGWRRL